MVHPQLRQVTDLADPALDDYLRMTDVRLRSRVEVERGLFMAESYEVISRAIEAGMAPRSFLMNEKWLAKFAPLYEQFPDVPVYAGEESLVAQLTGFNLHRGALASMQRPELPAVEELLRTARTVAVDAVLVTPQCADPLYRRSIRVSMGTVFQVPWTRLEAWPAAGVDLLHEAGFDVLAMALTEGAVPLDEVDLSPDRKVAFVLGAEGHGLKPATLEAVDQHVVIPMAGGVDSLNVAAASAVVFWQRRSVLSSSDAPAG